MQTNFQLIVHLTIQRKGNLLFQLPIIHHYMKTRNRQSFNTKCAEGKESLTIQILSKVNLLFILQSNGLFYEDQRKTVLQSRVRRR